MWWARRNHTTDLTRELCKKEKTSRRAKLTAFERCPGCQEFERACAAHFYLISKHPDRKHGKVTIALQDDWHALQRSADAGCSLCKCWWVALLGECATSAKKQSMMELPVIATSPETVASPLRTGIAETRDAHYFTISVGETTAVLRLGGVSKIEFAELMNQKSDMAWARDKLQTCHSKHTACSEIKTSSHLPTRLLSLRNCALVDGASLPPVAYAAMSYCWGGDGHLLELTASTEARLRAGVDPRDFSKTVQDAIDVCKQLNIHFLWVDAICIRQDGLTDWSTEAPRMNEVYGNAYVTLSISRAEGTADGFLHSSQRPIIKDVGSEVHKLYPVAIRKGLTQIKAESPTTKRGWIFQEELLSPRILFWSHHGLFWSCSELEDAENGTGLLGRDELFPQVDIPEMINPQDFRRTSDPLTLWDDMITIFSTRDFAVATDRLPAVAGLASLIATSTGEKYIYGLWMSRLPAQLLWDVTGEHVNRTDHPLAPSWSWASIDPARRIQMSHQGSARARLLACDDKILSLQGRLRTFADRLRLSPWPLDEERDVTGRPRFPSLENTPDIWAINQAQRPLLICPQWKQPIIIRLDNPIPSSSEDMTAFFDSVQCFEVNYLGLLLLRSMPNGTYRRIGCAQCHSCPGFFDNAAEVDILLA